MPNRNHIYLMALSAILLCCFLLTLWILTPAKGIAWLALFGSILALVITLVGLKKVFLLHSQSSHRSNPQAIYKYDLLGQSSVLIFALVFSFLSAQNFKDIAFSPVKANQVEILVSNTSDQQLDEINLKLGTFSRQFKAFPARKQEKMTVPLALSANLVIELKHQGQTRQSTLLVQPSDHQVLLRLDYNQNILPELH